MQQVTIELSEATLESLEAIADEEYEGNRSAAVRELLDAWLDEQQ